MLRNNDPKEQFLNHNIEYRKISSLKRSERNPRTHSLKQIRQIAASIESFGWTNPVLIDDTDRIVAGHGRIEAAKLLGMKRIPTIPLTNMSDAQIRAYVIADNKLAELAGWDDELLAIELQALTELDLDFDIEITGFAMGEIDTLIDGLNSSETHDQADQIPELDPGQPVVSKPGDLWQLGQHRLLCGNA
jgi:ParB-like chromosome segregation protein Spo0J